VRRLSATEEREEMFLRILTMLALLASLLTAALYGYTVGEEAASYNRHISWNCRYL
jgi:hypothetical protein